MRNEKYNRPEKHPASVSGSQPEEAVSKEDPKGKKRWKLVFDIMAIALIVLFFYGVFIYLPSITTDEIDCDDPDVIITRRNWHPMIDHPCDSPAPGWIR